MSKFGKIGWLFGLIFGAVFGVLFAPRKGKELREKMRADRKKGRLGIAPLGEDMQKLGQEIAAIAKELYESEPVSGIIERGRHELKKLSGGFVDEIADFHKQRIAPAAHEIKNRIKKGRHVLREAGREAKDLKKKIKTGVKIGKKAFKAIKGVMRKNKG